MGDAHVIVYGRIFLRGLLMVTLVSGNTALIASRNLRGAMCASFAISSLWWTNSAQDRPQARGAWVAYGAGAAVGTWVGLQIAGWIASV